MITTLPPSPPWTPVTDITVPSTPPSSRVTSVLDVAKPSPTLLPQNDQQDPQQCKSNPHQPPTPTEIPLPPSPPAVKDALSYRRPPFAPGDSRRVSSNARTASGRRVSGALQYALQGDRQRQVSDASSLDLAYYEQMREEAIEDERDEDERPQWDSSLGFGGAMPDIADSSVGVDEDEAWMGYVRQQLNTLCPDLFQSERGQGGLARLDDDFDVSVSTIATSDLPTPPSTGADNSLQILGSRAPNVREEIGGLREEIERLRGVISGLAEDLRGQPADPPASDGTAQEVGTGIDSIHRPFPDTFLKVSGQ